jgi:hypothetical protein
MTAILSIQFAEKPDLDFAFGWGRAGAPRTPGFGVMGGAVHRCDKRLVFSPGFGR